jgi:predicted transcriptional regulator
VDEFVDVSLLQDQEAWLAEHGSEIRTKIEQGYAAAQRGEVFDTEQVRSGLDQKKHESVDEKRGG